MAKPDLQIDIHLFPYGWKSPPWRWCRVTNVTSGAVAHTVPFSRKLIARACGQVAGDHPFTKDSNVLGRVFTPGHDEPDTLEYDMGASAIKMKSGSGLHGLSDAEIDRRRMTLAKRKCDKNLLPYPPKLRDYLKDHGGKIPTADQL